MLPLGKKYGDSGWIDDADSDRLLTLSLLQNPMRHRGYHPAVFLWMYQALKIFGMQPCYAWKLLMTDDSSTVHDNKPS
jgi:hypothetical protein